jgi:ABC-type Zn uptake system ZnuABC Zn-binding protein ZnuA
VYSVLKERNECKFIPYHEAYSYLGRRYCLKKKEIRELLNEMEKEGYLERRKRGIIFQ